MYKYVCWFPMSHISYDSIPPIDLPEPTSWRRLERGNAYFNRRIKAIELRMLGNISDSSSLESQCANGSIVMAGGCIQRARRFGWGLNYSSNRGDLPLHLALVLVVCTSIYVPLSSTIYW